MRFQEQRIPSTHFSQHLQAQDQAIRDNLNFAGQTNRRMKEDIQAAKRKLNSSSSTGLIRNNAFFQHTENNRNLVNVQQRPNRSNNFSDNLTPQYNTQSQFFRKVGPEVPEEADEEFEVLRREIVEARKQNEGLRQVITQNDASARFAISQLQSTIDAVRAENEKIKISYQLLSKQSNDQRSNNNSTVPEGACPKCQKMERRIKELEDQLAETNQQLNKELKKRAEANQTNSTFRSQLSERLRSMEEKMLKGNQEILKYESLNFELTRKLSESQQREFYFTQQLNTLSQQLANTTEIKTRISFDYERIKNENERLRSETETVEKRYLETINQVAYLSSKVEAINAEIVGGQDRGKADLTVGLGELEERVGELRYQLEEKTTENREYEIRIAEKDVSMKKLSEEYGESLEKIEHLEQALAHYRQSNEELQAELDRIRSQESPARQEKAEQIATQLRWEEAIHAEYAKVQNLNQQIQQKDETVNSLRLQLQEIHNYVHTVTINSEKTVQELNLTITHLYQQSQSVQRRNQELEAIVSRSKQEISQNSFDIVREREEIIATREELRRKAQSYEEALQEINYQQERNIDLDENIYALKSQLNNCQLSLTDVEQRLSSSETQRWRLESFITECNIKVRRYEQQNSFFKSQLNEYKHRVHILEQELVITKRIIEEKQENLLKKEKEIKEGTISQNKDRVSQGQGQQSGERFYQKKLFEAERYIQQMHQTALIQQQALAQQSQEIEAIKGDSLRYKQIIDEIAVKQIRINEEISRNEVIKISLEERLSHLQPLLRQESEKNSKSQQTIEIQHEEIERLNRLILSKDSELQLIKRDFTTLIDENTELRGYRASIPTNNDYIKRIEQLQLQFNGWTHQLNSNLQAKQDEINKLTSELTLLQSRGNLQPATRQEDKTNEGKLFKAERYIDELLHININYEQTQQKRQQQITILQEKLRNIELLYFELQNDNKNLREIVSKADSVAKTQSSVSNITVLESRIQQSEQRLKNQITEGTKLKQAIQALSDQLRQEKATAVIISNESKANQEKAAFFEQKLVDAEAFITQLFEKEKEYTIILDNNEIARHNDGLQIASLSEQLRGALKHIEELTVNLDVAKKDANDRLKESQAIKKQVILLEQQIYNIQNQKSTNELSKAGEAVPAEDFRERLEAAEAHIRYLEKELGGHLNTIQVLNKEIDGFRTKASENEAKERQISSLSAQLQGALRHIEELTSYSRAKEEQIIYLTSIIEKVDAQPHNQPHTDQSINQAIQNYKAQLAQANQQIQTLYEAEVSKEQILAKLSQQNEVLRRNLRQNEQALAQFQSQSTNLLKELANAETVMAGQKSSKDFLASKLEEAQTHIRYLQQELPSEHLHTIEKLQKYLDEAEQKAKQNDSQGQEQISSLTFQLHNFQQRINELEEAKSQLEQLHHQNLHEKNINDEALIHKQAQIQSLKKQISELQKGANNRVSPKISELQALVQNNANQAANFENKLYEAEAYIQQLLAKQQLYVKLEAENNDIKGQISNLSQSFLQSQADNLNLANKLTKTQETIASLAKPTINQQIEDKYPENEALLRDLKTVSDQKEFFRIKLLDAEQHIHYLTHQLPNQHLGTITKLQKHLEQAEGKAIAWEKNVLQSEKKNQAQITVLAQNIRTAQKRVRELESQRASFEEKMTALQPLISEKKKLQGEKNTLQQLSSAILQKISHMQGEITYFQKLTSTHQINLEQYQGQAEKEISSLKQQNTRLREALTRAEEQLRKLGQIQSITEERLRSREQQIINLSAKEEKDQTNTSPVANEEAQFFKNKLMEAQAYLAQLEQQNVVKQTAIAQKEQELQAVCGRISQAEDIIKAVEIHNSLLAQEIENLKKVNEQLRETAKNAVPKSELNSLETRLKQDDQKLQSEISEGNKLRKAIETLSEQLRQEKAANFKTTNEIQAHQDKAAFLENKLLQAENYISQLQKKETFEEKNKGNNLQDMKKQTEQLITTINKINGENQRLLGEVKTITEEREFFKGKLNDAETHINYLENEVVPIVEASKKELETIQKTSSINEKRSAGTIASLSSELQEATKYIEELSSHLNTANNENQVIKKQVILLEQQIYNIQNQKSTNELSKAGEAVPAEDFRERLEAAEAHIRYLEKELGGHLNTIQVLNKEIDGFRTKASENEAKERQISSLSAQLQGATKKVEEVTVDLNASKKETIELAKENEAIKKQAKAFELQLFNIQNQKSTNELSKAGEAVPAEDFRERLEAAEAHIRYLEKELGGHLNTIQVLNKEIDGFRTKASENQTKQKQISNLSEQLQGALRHIEELTNNLQVQEKQVYRLSQALTKIASTPQVEPSPIQQINNETIESYKTNLALADQQIKRILEENTAKDQLLSQLQKENNDSKRLLISLRNELVNSQTQNKVLLDEIAKAEQAAKDQDNASNEDKQFFKHKLADAEEHIAYLENHRIKELQNMIQQQEKRINEASKKTKTEGQPEGKNQPQIVAMTKRISDLQILAAEREKLEAEKNALQKQNAEASQRLISLQEDKETANERANYSENLLMETIKQLEDLKQKMKDAEDYIYNVQTENNRLKETVNASVPAESIYALPEYVSLEEKVKLLEEQNHRLGQIQQAKASNLQTKVDAKPIEDAAFFKSKLLEAERYIEEIEHINLGNQQIIYQQNDDIKNFEAKVAQLEATNAALVKNNSIISSELRKANDTNNQLKEAVTSLASPEKLVALENMKKQAEKKLAQKTKEAQDLTAEVNLVRLQNKKKDDQIENMKAEKESSDNEAAFFKQKLFDAESYITAIEEVEHSNKELNNKLKKFVEIQEQIESLKKIKNTLSKEVEAKSLKIANLEKTLQQFSQQGEFFKRKLLDAETHIKFLEEELANIGNIDQALDQLTLTEQKAKEWQEKAKNFENRNKELALMNHQLLNQLNEPRQTGEIQKLEDSLVQLKSRLLESEANNRELLDQLMEERSENSRAKVTSPDKSDFFKEKLLEAESYINQLEEQNNALSTGIDALKNQVESLKGECKQREKILVNLEEQINNYAEDLRESEVEKEALQLRYIELEQKIDPLTKKVEILDGQLAREQEFSNKEIQNITKKLETANAMLKETERQLQQQFDNEAKLAEQKLAAEERANKYENLSNTLQETLNILDNLHKPFSQQEESIEQLKEHLSAAEKREEDLRIKDAAKGEVIQNLQRQKERENTYNQQLREKFDNLLTENASLRAENDELLKQLQSLRQVDVPVADNSSLLRNLQEQQDKYNEMMRQLEQLTGRIKLTEQQNFEMKSLKEIAEKKVKQNETTIRVLEEKVKSEKYIPIEDEDNKIEKVFMDEKLREAQELITQQQNQINRLTEELIQQQNQSLRYSGDLTSKIKEENNLNNIVKQLSNSRRLLDEKIRNLQIENEAIKIEKLEQSKQLEAAEKEIQTVQETLSTFFEEKAVADDIAEASKKELKDLEDRYSVLILEVAQLKEALKQKEEQIDLENAQKDGKVDRPVTSEQNNNKQQLYQVKINEIQKEKQDLQANNNTLQDQLQHYQEIITTLNGQIVQKQSDKIILSAQNDKLIKQLEDQITKSSQLEQQKQQLNQQLQQIKERQNSLNSKLDYLEKELENNNNIIQQLLNEKDVAEQKIADLQKAIESLKTEKDKDIQSLLEQVNKNEQNIAKITSELEFKNEQLQVLNNEINPLNSEKEQLLKRSGELQQEIWTLRADKADSNMVQTLTARLSQAEEYIAQLEEGKDNANQIFKNLTTQMTSMKEQVESLRNELNNSVSEKQRLADAISDLQNQIQLAQSDNQRLTSKVSYLQSVNELKDKEIADLSEFSVNKEQNSNEKSGSKPEGNSNANILPDQYKESNDSKNDLEKSKKVNEQQNAIKELQEQIRALNAELQSKDEAIRQLTVENVNINDENKELSERINNQNIDSEEELRQHLVQVDRTNYELQEENRQLLNDLQLLAKEKAYLEGEINQLKAKDRLDNSGEEPKTTEEGANKTYKPVSEPKSEGYNISLLKEEIEQLKQQLAEQRIRGLGLGIKADSSHALQIRGQELLSLEVDNDALKHSKQELQEKLEKTESERLRLLLKLKDAQEAIARLQDEYKAEQQHFLKEKSELAENLNIAEKKINKLEEKEQGQGQGQASLGENLKKILDITKNFNEEIEPEDITQHLQNYPYLNELITSILYRLRLSTALELEKSIKIKQLTEELAEAQNNALEASDLRTANDFLRSVIERLEEQQRDKQDENQKRYGEVLQELVFYETLNKELQEKMKEISGQYQLQKQRLDGYEKQINTPILDNSGLSPQDNDLSRENYELRRKLQSSERTIQQFKNVADSSGSINTKDVFYLEFLNTCLDKVVDLQKEVQEVERDIEQAAALETSQRNTSSRNEDGKGSDSALQDKLQELEDKLLKNAHNIREHQKRSDNELFELLKELSEVKELPQFNKNRIDDYLTQLENQILKDHEQHINEVSRLRDQLAASQEQSGRSNESLDEFNKVNKDKLLKEINNLNNTIEIYHQQSMRRKKNYKRTIESLLRDIEKIKERQETLAAEGKTAFDDPLNEAMLEITDKLRYTIEKDEEEDSKQIDLGEDDFIISNNYVQILDGREKDGKNLSGLQENFGEYMEKNVQSVEVQTEEDHRPFLSFILSNQNLDKEDIRLLKKKIADMRAKEVQENLQALRAQEKKLEEVLMMNNRENPQQLDNIILTLANNYSRDEISQIFGSQDQDEILNKLNEALCMEDSFYKGENSSTMMKDIQERMLRHYESPTKLSEQVYTHLINLLSAKKDDEFYDEIQLLFRDLFEIQAGFEQALRKKDELYRVHNERMNQIFNRSSSDGSEEYLTIFERQNNEDPLQMHSQRKPRNSEHEDEVER